jgi:hypothetical protein
MFDPRIYRTGLVVVALAALVLAFSFDNQQGALSSRLAPDAFNGNNVYASMMKLAQQYPDRSPGTSGDDDVANAVFRKLTQFGFAPSTDTFSARTPSGERTLENVVGVRPGMQSGSVVIIAHRDASGSSSKAALSGTEAALSGTATLIELARDLEGETLHRTVVLASTSGSQGTAGAIRLAQKLGGPIDAVIVLGDLASSHVRQPIIVPWAQGQQVAPPMLRNTIAAALNQQAGLHSGGTSLFGQFAHLAFPLTLTEQGPFGARGIPAVLLSLSGERGPAADAAISSADTLTSVGQAVLSAVSALNVGQTVPAASPYVLFDNKVVPGWAISVFVLALVIPVLLTTIDGFARALRRGYLVWRWVLVVLLAAVPFALGALVILGARLVGTLAVAPPGPVGPEVVPIHTSGVVVMVIAAAVALLSALALAPMAVRFAAGSGRSRDLEGSVGGATASVLLVMCAVTIAIWLRDPFAAALVVPALHLWLLALNGDVRMPLAARLLLMLLGLVPIAAVVVYYGATLGFGPLAAAWAAVLLIAGHVVTPLQVLPWTVVLGCVLTAGGIVVALARQPRPEEMPVTVRGPITYAGPGSLGGTKSALRR